jgi:Cu+-exporting ATPase
MKNATAMKDPVCGMNLEAVTAAGQTEYKGRSYYFCGTKCKEKFDHSAEQYLISLQKRRRAAVAVVKAG